MVSQDRHVIDVLVGDNTRIHAQLMGEALKRDRCLRVIGSAAGSREFLDLAARHTPNVALLSATMDEDPNLGITTLRQFHAAHPNIPAIVLLESSKREVVLEAFRSGARGIFSKHESLENLCKCVRAVHEGQIWANSREVRFALEVLANTPSIRAVNADGISLLSKREREVVEHLAEGLTNREIGERMGLSQHTVKNYLLRIFDKLGVSNRVELLSLTLQQTGGGVTMSGNGALHNSPSLRWYQDAADKGEPHAQLKLAELHREGRDLPKDPVAAYAWYLVFGKTSEEQRRRAHLAKEKLLATMTAEEIVEAERRAAEWLARNGKPAAYAAADPRAPLTLRTKAGTVS
jgi:two-component system, NarL family, nitrate/nitrite response regulator NarL